MTFTDIALVPVSSDRQAAYLAFSRRMAEVYRDHGATQIIDYWPAGDPANQAEFHAEGIDEDAIPTHSLASLIGATAQESVVVTLTQWPSRKIRDRGVLAATKDPRVLATLGEEPIFDGRRLVADSFITFDTDDAGES